MTLSEKVIRRAIEAAYNGEYLADLSSLENPETLVALRWASKCIYHSTFGRNSPII